MVSKNKGNLPTQRGPERGMLGRGSRYTPMIWDNISRVSMEPDKSVFEGRSSNSSSSLAQGMAEIPLHLLRKSTLLMIIEDLTSFWKATDRPFENSEKKGNHAHDWGYHRNGNRAQERRYYRNGKMDAHGLKDTKRMQGLAGHVSKSSPSNIDCKYFKNGTCKFAERCYYRHNAGVCNNKKNVGKSNDVRKSFVNQSSSSKMAESQCSALKIEDSNDCNRSDRDGNLIDENNVAESKTVNTSESKSSSERIQTNVNGDDGEENTNLNGLFCSNEISDKNTQTPVINVSSGKKSSDEDDSDECKIENRNKNSKQLFQKTGRQYGKRKRKRNAKRASCSTDANISVDDQSKLEDVKMMIENWEKSGLLNDKTQIQKMKFFRNNVNLEIWETMKWIDPESKLDSLDAIVAKVDFLLHPSNLLNPAKGEISSNGMKSNEDCWKNLNGIFIGKKKDMSMRVLKTGACNNVS